uniref:Uncharacterized protein n=1 Tax=Rhizophora mucronata TaxID=61149 RepID=A0A2P2PX85_RHIMU
MKEITKRTKRIAQQERTIRRRKRRNKRMKLLLNSSLYPLVLVVNECTKFPIPVAILPLLSTSPPTVSTDL